MAKTLGLHIGDTPEDAELEKYIRAQAKSRFGKKTSAYLRHAVESERSGGSPDAMSANVMVELTRRLLGELDAGEMARAMEGKDQRQKLKALLERVLTEEFDLDLHASDYIVEGGSASRTKRIEEVATMAAENFRHFLERRIAIRPRSPELQAISQPPQAVPAAPTKTRKPRSA